MKKFFILGNPRSGTSLFRIMLNCHPKIAAAPECGFLQWWYDKYGNWSEKSYGNGEFSKFLNDFFESRKIETWELNKDALKSYLLNKKPDNYDELMESIYLHWALKSMKQPEVLVDKNNYYIHHLTEINEIWSDAHYVMMIRDGRDVACSYKRMKSLKSESPYKPDLPTKIDDIAREWDRNQKKILSFLTKLDSKRYMIIKYENLIRETRSTLTKVCHFLDQEFSKEMLSYYIKNKVEKMEPDATLDWKQKTLEKPDGNNLEKYKDQLSSAEIRIFNDLANDMLRKFGYLS